MNLNRWQMANCGRNVKQIQKWRELEKEKVESAQTWSEIKIEMAKLNQQLSSLEMQRTIGPKQKHRNSCEKTKANARKRIKGDNWKSHDKSNERAIDSNRKSNPNRRKETDRVKEVRWPHVNEQWKSNRVASCKFVRKGVFERMTLSDGQRGKVEFVLIMNRELIDRNAKWSQSKLGRLKSASCEGAVDWEEKRKIVTISNRAQVEKKKKNQTTKEAKKCILKSGCASQDERKSTS